jgi:hypothetical protein
VAIMKGAECVKNKVPLINPAKIAYSKFFLSEYFLKTNRYNIKNN